MAYQQIGDILHHTHQLRERIRNIVREALARQNDGITRALIERFDAHDFRMQRLLEMAARNASREVLQTWIQYADTAQIEREADILRERIARGDPNAADVVQEALQLDQQMLQFFYTTKEQTSAPRVRAFFDDLLDMEEQKARDKSRNAVEVQDL